MRCGYVHRGTLKIRWRYRMANINVLERTDKDLEAARKFRFQRHKIFCAASSKNIAHYDLRFRVEINRKKEPRKTWNFSVGLAEIELLTRR